jgi:nitrite reductase/ring-hydroxylating ferredoxin subunit
MKQEITWYKIADSLTDLPINTNGLCEVEVNGKTICIAIANENVKACASKCPHAGGNMSSGYVDALGNIVCPLHRYKFSLANGRNTSGEGYFLKTYPIEERENGIFVGLATNSMFNWIK